MFESVLETMRRQFRSWGGGDVAQEAEPPDTTCPPCRRAPRPNERLWGFLPLFLATGLSPGLLALLGVMIEATGLVGGASRTLTCTAFLSAPVVLLAWSHVVLRRSGEAVSVLDGVPIAMCLAFANALLLAVGLSFVGLARRVG